MSKVVILEGPDGAGKTTLANELCELVPNSVYLHTGPPVPGKSTLIDYGTKLWAAVHGDPKLIVLDRLHLGELVYGPIVRGEDTLTHDGLRLINRIIRANDVCVVICLPPKDACIRNYSARKGSEYVPDEAKLGRIWDMYSDMLKNGFTSEYIPCKHYDYTSLTTDVNELLEKKPTFPPLFSRDGVIGHLGGPFFFIGEVANQETLDLPFFSLEGSSAWLNDLLAAVFEENQICMTNAFRLDGSPRELDAIYGRLRQNCPRLQPVALGRKAAAQCRKHFVPYHELPHPAYWKRFHSSKRGLYKQWLQEIREAYFGKIHRWFRLP